MKSTKKCTIFLAGLLGAGVAMLSAWMAIKTWDKKNGVCHEMKKKAKKAFKEIEERLDV